MEFDGISHLTLAKHSPQLHSYLTGESDKVCGKVADLFFCQFLFEALACLHLFYQGRMIIDTEFLYQLVLSLVKNILGSDNLGVVLNVIVEGYSRLKAYKARGQVE